MQTYSVNVQTPSYEVVYEAKEVKVQKVAENEYRVMSLSARNEDGIYDTSWNEIAYYTNDYCRDWLGHVYSHNYNPNQEEDYAYKQAIQMAKNIQ